MSFEIDKTEAVLFTRKRSLYRKMQRAKIKLENTEIGFNSEATRWLGIWLDSDLNFKAHYQIRLQKAKKAENKLKFISSTFNLTPELIRRVQITAVQSVTLYGAEI